MSSVIDLCFSSRMFSDELSFAMIIMKSPEFTYTFYSTTQTNILFENNLPYIEMDGCLEAVKEEYNFQEDEILYISQLSYKRVSLKTEATETVDYEIYTDKGVKLNNTVCDNIEIQKSLPINIDAPGLDLSKAQEYEKEEIDVFNREEPLFNDDCTYYRKDGKDYTIDNRVALIYQPISFCENGCSVKHIQYDINYVSCECPKANESNGGIEGIIESSKTSRMEWALRESTNIKIFKCFKTILMDLKLYENTGFWISCFLFLTTTICGAWFFKLYSNKMFSFAFSSSPPKAKITWDKNNHNMSYKNTRDINRRNSKYDDHQVIKIIKSNSNSSENSINTDTNLNKEENARPSMRKYNTIKDVNTLSIYKKNNVNKTEIETKPINSIPSDTNNNNTAIRWENEPEPSEMNHFAYDIALQEDKRPYLLHFYHVYKDKQIFFYILSQSHVFNPPVLRIEFMSFIIGWFFFLTALFYSDKYITERNNSPDSGFWYMIKHELIKNLYASIWGLFIAKVITFGNSYGRTIKQLKRESKSRGESAVKIIKSMKIMKIVNIFIFIFIEVVGWFGIYFLTVFCILLKNNQVNWLISSLITVIFNWSLSLGFTIVICFFKFIGWKYKMK